MATARAAAPDGSPQSDGVGRRATAVRVLLTFVVLGTISFWVWALFFAPKEAVNKIGDRQWAARAEAICAATELELRELERLASTELDVRADLVVRSTDLLGAMLDDVVAIPPDDEKGRAIVPDWEADYRTLLEDRYRYAEQLRRGEDGPFTETAVQGIPITERIETFAGDNEMDSCAPPRGSVV